MPTLQNVTSTGRRSDAWKDEPENAPVEAALQSKRDATFSEEDDFFCILGISPNATVSEIQSAFERKSRHYHPDEYDEDSQVAASKNFRYVEAAYEVLIDDNKRSLYKTYGHQIFGKVLNDPLLRQHHMSVIFNIVLNTLKPYLCKVASGIGLGQAIIVQHVFMWKFALAIYVVAVCAGTGLFLALLSGLLMLTFGVSLMAGAGLVVLIALSTLSGVAFTYLLWLMKHYWNVQVLNLLTLDSIKFEITAQNEKVVESDKRTESRPQYEATEDGSAAELNGQASGNERAQYGSSTVHQGSHNSLRRRDPAAAESASPK